jgi:hypothetical protein
VRDPEAKGDLGCRESMNDVSAMLDCSARNRLLCDAIRR